MGKKRKKGLGDSTLGTGKGRMGKTRSKMRGLGARSRPSRKGRRVPGTMGKSKLAQSSRRHKMSKLARASFGNVFKSRMMGRGFGSIFQGRKSSGKGLANIFKKAMPMPGLTTGERPKKGIGFASAGRGKGFGGGIFKTVLGGMGGRGWGFSLNSDLSGLVEPTATLEIKVIVAIHSYLRARVRSKAGKQRAKALRETFKASPSLGSGAGLLARSRWDKYDRGAVRQARQRFYELLDSTTAEYILNILDNRYPAPNDLEGMKANGFHHFSPRLLRVILEARAILHDDSLIDDAASEGGLASLEEERIDEIFISEADLVQTYVKGRFNRDLRAYNQARRRLRGRLGKQLANRVLRWTTGETRIPSNLNTIKGLEDAPPELREAIVTGREIFLDLANLKAGIIDETDQEVDERLSRHEEFLGTHFTWTSD